jgi:ABC-type glycerol-3-phosphate transport system substrate-binding protein
VELMAGGGPDIILFHLRTFNSINKVVKTGVFCEMDDYIKKYDVIKYDEYNKSLLDGGVYKGKRYYIPLYYYGSNLCSTNVLLDENSIKINNSGWTWDEFVDSSKEFMKKNRNNGKYFLSSNYGLFHMMLNWEEPLIDYENQKPNFNSDTFKKLLTVYKELYPAKAPEGSDTKSMIKNKKILFQNGPDNPLTCKYCYEDYKAWNLGDLVLVPTPSLSGKRIENAIPAQGIAINSRCRNKEAAFKFLKIAISYDMQRYYYKNGETNGNLNMPINNKAFKDDLLSYTTLPKQLVNQAVQEQSITGSSLIKDYNIIDMAKELAVDYISGKKTVDQVAKELDDKANVFLNE